MKLKLSATFKPVFYIGCFIILSSCNSSPRKDMEVGSGSAKEVIGGIITEEAELKYDLAYEGILPCKDCGGIKTTLKLSTHENKFSLTEEFLKTEIAPSVLLGHFNTERGFEKDADATVYILNDDLPEGNQMYFVRETGKDGSLLKLDNSKQRTNHTNFELKKIAE